MKLPITRYVNCPFSKASDLAASVLQGRREVYVTPFGPLRALVSLTATVTPDATDCSRKHDAILVGWHPVKRWLPDLRALLTFRPHLRGSTLRITALYEPRYGVFGRFADWLIGRGIARLTFINFLDDIAAAIEAEYERSRDRRAEPPGSSSKLQSVR